MLMQRLIRTWYPLMSTGCKEFGRRNDEENEGEKRATPRFILGRYYAASAGAWW